MMAVRSLAGVSSAFALGLCVTACVPAETEDALQSQRDDATIQAQDTFDRQNTVATESAFIADAMFSPAAVTRFRHRACPQDDSQTDISERCASLLYKSFLTRLGDKYTVADFRAVFHYCDGYPEECTPEHTFEAIVRKSQREEAGKLLAKRETEAREDYDREMAAAKAAVGQALAEGAQAFAESMTSHVTRTTRCRTSVDGNGVDCVERAPNK
jgi:hypothetical protein